MTKAQQHKDIITEFEALGMTLQQEQIPELLNVGVDAFLEKRSIHLAEKTIGTLRLMLHCIKESEYTIHKR